MYNLSVRMTIDTNEGYESYGESRTIMIANGLLPISKTKVPPISPVLPILSYPSSSRRSN